MFSVSKVHRSVFDSLLQADRPQPPTQMVDVWGGLEEAYMYDDPSYINKLRVYNSEFYTKRHNLFLEAIDFDHDKIHSIMDKELYTLTNDVLLASLSSTQIYELFNTVEYLSTVTDKGIRRAFNMFDATWHGTKVHTIKLKKADINYTNLYRDMSVAHHMGYTWNDFCSMTGQEQSNVIALNQIRATLEHLERQQ